MTTSNVVVMFPKMKKEHPPQNIEEMKTDIDNMKKNKAEMVVDATSMAIFDTFALCGIDINSQEYMKDILWMLEAVRATVYRKLELPHEIHNLSEIVYEAANDGDTLSWIGDYKKIKIEGE